MSKKAVVLLSGGLDSTTCLAIAKDQGYECYTLSFDYGQRHRVELEKAAVISKVMQAARHQVFKLSLDDFKGSALTDNTLEVPSFSDSGEDDIPITYVPARNTIFLSVAMGYAEVLQAEAIYIGASSVDYSGYPDCRPEFFTAFQQLAGLATKHGVDGNPLKIETPLIHLSKKQTIEKGHELGVDYSLTVSCYQASKLGEACGKCDSCVLRQKGFNEAGVLDPTLYSASLGAVNE